MFESIPMTYGDYRCEDSFQVELALTMLYFGSLVGFLVVAWVNDNLGRRKSMLIGMAVSLVGVLLIASSFNMHMAQIGLFCAGFGINPSLNTVFYFIA